MIDNYNRKINYLRISLTQKCNYNCLYCKPNPKDKPLDINEIDRIINIFSLLGIEHVRFSGGEPLIRKDLEQIIKNTRKIPSIKTINITSNGSLLENRIPTLINEGLNSINISIDATDKNLYKKITGGGNVDKVLKAIEEASNSKLKVKLNAVLLKDYWKTQIQQLSTLAKTFDIPLRFIELMPIGIASSIEGISSDQVIPYLKDKYGETQESEIKGNGPAKYLKINGTDYGFIDALSHNFCSSCNRIRLLSDGKIKLCLYQAPNLNIKDYFSLNDNQILEKIKSTLCEKNEHHNLNEKAIKMTMASIGG